jgi:hypothetical protein
MGLALIFAKVADLLPRKVRETLFFLGVKKALRKAGVKGDDVDKITSLIKGWKTKGAGLSAVLGGALIIVHTLSGEFSFDELMKGWAAVSAGLMAMGWAGKKEKETAAVLLSSPNASVIADTKASLEASGTKVP